MKTQPNFQTILGKRLSRRSVLANSSALAASSLFAGCSSTTPSALTSHSTSESFPPNLPFSELPQGLDEHLAVAEGYESQVLIRWGDPLFSSTGEFDPLTQTADKQAKQFGFNNDFIGFLPLSTPLVDNEDQPSHGLLVVNHEYTNPHMMFPGSPKHHQLSIEQTNTDIMAHGLSVVEVYKKGRQWHIAKDSAYNRRITPYTPMQLTGAAAGSKRLTTSNSPDGVKTLGTYGNCAGGVTPWGTVLSGEENINYMFSGDYSNNPEHENYTRFGMTARARKSWSQHHSRWDMNKEANEPLHMGWIVEIDPYSPESKPRKLTALGRFKHEGCNIYINKDQRVVAYCGDDQGFEYLYKFVSKNTYKPDDRKANLTLLDEGTLYCARFNDDGTVQWLPLVYGSEKLTHENGFNNQGDILLDTRKAADLLGATPMDRPEDVEVNPANGRVYVMLTNNDLRNESQTDGPNPRASNRAGQIIELLPPDNDHTSDAFKWDIFLLAGKRSDASTTYHPLTTENGWLACPDNCAFDTQGNIWIATDGAEKFGIADGIWASPVEGPYRGLTKRFLRTPKNAELCGPFFTENNRNLFCSVQHPGEKSSFDHPSTRWPDFDENTPPRPAVVVITKKDGGIIGS